MGKVQDTLGRIPDLLLCIGADQVDVAGTRYFPLMVMCSHLIAFVQIASQYSSIFDKLLVAYAQIGEALPRFDRYRNVFQQPDFQHVLALVYADILEFHRRAYKILNRRGMSCWPRSFRVSLTLSSLEFTLSLAMDRFRTALSRHPWKLEKTQ